MNKVRKSVLWMILALVLPMTQAWAGNGGSFTGWAKLTANASPSGAGTVYVSDSTITSTDGLSSAKTASKLNKTTSGSAPTSANVTFYVKVVPANENYGFTGWNTGSNVKSIGSKTSAETTVVVTSNSSSETKPVEASVTATFAEFRQYNAQLRVEVVGGGTVAVTSGAAPGEYKTVDSLTLTSSKTVKDAENLSFKVFTRPESEEWEFKGWKLGTAADSELVSSSQEATYAVSSSKSGDEVESVTLYAIYAKMSQYYARVRAATDEGGEVAVGTSSSSSGLTYGTSAALESNAAVADVGKTFPFYVFARPEDGWWNFIGWFEDDWLVSTDSAYGFNVVSNSSDEQKPAERALKAKFERAPVVTVTCKANEQCDYTVSAQGDASDLSIDAHALTADEAIELPRMMSLTLSAPTPAVGYRFVGWWVEQEDGSHKLLATQAEYTADFTESAVIGVELDESDNYFRVVTDKYKTFDSAIAALPSGKGEILLQNDLVVNENLEIPTAVTLTVPFGRVLTVSEDATLTVNGSLYVDGSVDSNGSIARGDAGIVSVCQKTLKQKGVGDQCGEVASPYNPYGSVKYWITSADDKAKGSLVSTTQAGLTVDSHLTVVNGFGMAYHCGYTGSVPGAIICTIDRTTAENHVTGIEATTYANLSGAYAKCGTGKLVVLVGTGVGTINVGTTTNFQTSFNVDGLGQAVTITCKQINGGPTIRFINCGNVTVSKLMTATLNYIKCAKVIISSWNITSETYQGRANLYDCTDISVNWDGNYTIGGGAYIYSGGTYLYNLGNGHKNFHLYGGTYKYEPKYVGTSANCTLGPGLTVKEISKTEYKVVEATTSAGVWLTKDGTTTAQSSLAAAVEAAGNVEATIELGDDVTLSEPLTIGSEQNIYLNLSRYGITGDAGALVNKGSLVIDGLNSASGSLVSEGGAILDCQPGSTTHIVYGNYRGAININGGLLYTHAGTFDTTFEVGEGVDPKECVFIRAGQFSNTTYDVGPETQSLLGLCPDGYKEYRDSASAKYVYLLPDANIAIDMAENGKVGSYACDMVLSFSLMTEDDRRIYSLNKARQYHRNLGDWYRRAELAFTEEILVNGRIDCALSFDRKVAAGSVSAYGQLKSVPLAQGGKLPRGLSPEGTAEQEYAEGYQTGKDRPSKKYYYVLYENGVQQSVSTFVGEAGGVASCGIRREGTSVIGTTCTLEMITYGRRTNTEYLNWRKTVATRTYKFNGGSNEALVGETLMPTLKGAIDGLEENGTVKLANDFVGKTVVLDAEKAFVLDRNNFELDADAIVAGEGCELTVTDLGNGQAKYEVVKQSNATLTIPPVANATVVVKVNGEVVAPVDGAVSVPVGAKVEVAYTAADGWLNDKTVTIDAVASDSTIDVGDYAPVKAVGKIGDTLVSAADFRTSVNAIAGEETVQLLADIDLGMAYVTIAKTASVTLDLNGKTLTSAASQTVSISGAGSLTITDTAEGGKIVNTKSTGKAVSGVNGSVALISGTVEGPESAITAKALAVSGGVAKAGNMAVSGGGTISGGTIISTNSYAVDASVSGVTLEITGGTIQGAAAKGDVRVYSGNLKATGITLANGIKFASNASGLILPGTDDSLFTAEVGIYDGETLVGYAPAQTTGTVGGMEGKTVKLLKDCTTTDVLTIGKSCTVDLNGHNLTTSAAVAIAVKGSSTTPSTVTIQGTGTVSSTLDAGCNAVQVGAYATLTIAGGTYVVPTDNAAVYIATSYVTKPSTVTIAGGTYESGDGKYTLNIKDDQVARGATICVTGGAFMNNFNPADNGAEGEHTNFVKDGYVAVEKSTGVWTVVLKPVDITITMDAAATAPIAVDPGWIAEKVGANATAEEIVEKLETVDENGFKGWQNYVMGVDGSVAANVLKPVEGVATESEKSGKTDPIVISAPFTANNAPAASASKIAVTYQLFKGVMGTNGQIVWGTEPVAESEKPRFAMDFKDTVGDTYWKIAVVFTAVK